MMAVKLAEQWCENSPTDRNALDIRKNLLALQQRSAVERILYQNNLASDEYLPYSHNPSQLIEKFTEEFCNSPESSMKGIILKFNLECIYFFHLEILYNNIKHYISFKYLYIISIL